MFLDPTRRFRPPPVRRACLMPRPPARCRPCRSPLRPQAKGTIPQEKWSAFSGTILASGRLFTVAFFLRSESLHRIHSEQLCSRYEQRPMKLLSKEYSCRTTRTSSSTIRQSLRIAVNEGTVKGMRPLCGNCQPFDSPCEWM